MRTFLCAVFVIMCLASTAQAYDTIWGKRAAGDLLLLREQAVHSPVANGYASATINFPNAGGANTRTISAIFAYDRFTNTSGAVANLWAGGPGRRFADIDFNSRYGNGINCTVEIYGN